MSLGSVAPPASALELGASLPAVQVLDQDRQEVVLAEAGADGFTLVYFYPKADTPGCTKQACSLRDAFAELAERGVRVFGVSHDTPEAQKAFQERYRLPFSLLADTEHAVSTAFGVPSRGEYAARQAYLFHDATLVWRDLEASTVEQAADVLSALDELAP